MEFERLGELDRKDIAGIWSRRWDRKITNKGIAILLITIVWAMMIAIIGMAIDDDEPYYKLYETESGQQIVYLGEKGIQINEVVYNYTEKSDNNSYSGFIGFIAIFPIMMAVFVYFVLWIRNERKRSEFIDAWQEKQAL